jgi:hypothetical protein
MKNTIKNIGCLVPRHTLFHCVLFALMFSHFISSPTAREVMNDYVDYALISKIGFELNKKNEAADTPSWRPGVLQFEQPIAPPRVDCHSFTSGQDFVISTVKESIATERLLL